MWLELEAEHQHGKMDANELERTGLVLSLRTGRMIQNCTESESEFNIWKNATVMYILLLLLNECCLILRIWWLYFIVVSCAYIF